MDLKDLYRDVIVDHNRSPRNFRQIEPPRRVADGHNPLCGDKLRVYLRVTEDTIEDVAFEMGINLTEHEINYIAKTNIAWVFDDINEDLARHGAKLRREKSKKTIH